MKSFNFNLERGRGGKGTAHVAVLHRVQMKNNVKRNCSRDSLFSKFHLPVVSSGNRCTCDEQGTVTVTRNGTQTTLIVNQDKDEDQSWIKQLGQAPQP